MKGRICPVDDSTKVIEFGTEIQIEGSTVRALELDVSEVNFLVRIYWDKKFSNWYIDYVSGSEELRLGETGMVSGSGPKPVFPPANLWVHGHYLSLECVADAPRLIGGRNASAKVTSGRIPLDKLKNLEIGRGETLVNEGWTRLVLDPAVRRVSSEHVLLERKKSHWTIENKGANDTILNGQTFDKTKLVFGDRFRIGPYLFAYFTDYLERLDDLNLGTVSARGLYRIVNTIDEKTGKAKKLSILSNANLDVHSGEFVAVIGGSGQGKSTLMNALCGVVPATKGKVWINKLELTNRAAILQAVVGFVPQDDIVHRELKLDDAVRMSAMLKLNLPLPEIESLVDRTLTALDLSEHRTKRVRKLSGGQRKRVSIATELLSSPSVLFLDEPTSGLDPAIEWEIMTALQKLAEAGMTVICTTHMLENAHICSRFVIVQEGRIIFDGPPSAARDHFLSQDDGKSSSTHSTSPGGKLASFSKIFKEIKNSKKSGKEWEDKFRRSPHYCEQAPIGGNVPGKNKIKDNRKKRGRVRQVGFLRTVKLLFVRQWKILAADRLNLLFLFAQAFMIGFMIGWVAEGIVLRSFLTVVATMWFGCSNGAQQIVGELSIFRRERVSGQGINAYIFSKFGFLSFLTLAQAALLMVTVYFSAFLFHNSEQGKLFAFPEMKDGKEEKFEEVLVGRLFALPKEDVALSEEIALNLLMGGVSQGSKPATSAKVGEVTGPGLVRSQELPGMLLAVENQQQWVPGKVVEFMNGERLRLPEQLPNYPSEGFVAQSMKPSMAQSPFLAKGGWRIFRKKEREKLWKPGATVVCSVTQQRFRLPDQLPRWNTETLRYRCTYTFLRFFMLEDAILDSDNVQQHSQISGGNNAAAGATGELALAKITWTVLGLKVMSLLLISVVGVAIGLMVSALVQNATQAVLWVPLVLIPQILFGGFVVKVPEMTRSVRAASFVFPSFTAQRIMDVSNIYGRIVPKISNKTKMPVFTEGDGETVKWVQSNSADGKETEKSEKFQKEIRENSSWQNLLVMPLRLGQHQVEGNFIQVFKPDGSFQTSIKQEPDTIDYRNDILPGYVQGIRFVWIREAQEAGLILLMWIAFCYIVVLCALRGKQTGE